jgi:hypothetical protein
MIIVDRLSNVRSAAARLVREELVRLKLRQMWHLAAGAVLAVAALFGGLDSVDAKPKAFNAGQAYSDGEFTLTIARAVALDEVRAGARVVAPAERGHVYLGLLTTIRNDGTIPARLDDELDLQGQPHKKFTGVFRIADSSVITALGPKLTEKVAYLWNLPQSAIPAGSVVTVRIWQKRFTELLVTYGKDWIRSETSYAQITLPVAVK